MKMKKKVSKKLKKSWRKHVDISDVEAFLDDKRLEERLGGVPFAERKNEDLFQIDTKPSSRVPLSRKEKARLAPLKCFSALENSSAVPDPLIKRNKVRSKEERQHPILKKKNEINRKNGILKKKDVKELKKYFQSHVRAFKQKPKYQIEIEKDLWTNEPDNESRISKLKNWMNDTTYLHTVRNTSCYKKSSNYQTADISTAIPSFEVPHPGISYNPSFKDHLELVNEVAKKEIDLQKKEAHLNRVTQNMFKHITEDQNQKNWIEEMSEGLPTTQKEETDGEISDGDYKAINPPVSREKKKTIQQRKKELRLKREELKRQEIKENKRKNKDILKAKKILSEVLDEEVNQNKKSLKKLQKSVMKFEQVRRVGKNKLPETEEQFLQVTELSGSLRELIPQGNILKDKFRNMQKRNLIEVMKPQLKTRKKKVKKYQTASHRLEPTEFSAAEVLKNMKRKKKIKNK